MFKKFLTFLYRWLKFPTREEEPEKQQEQKPVPPEAVAPELPSKEPTPKPTTAPAKVPPAKKKPKRYRKPPHPKKDKKGFHILTDRHDLGELFQAEKHTKKGHRKVKKEDEESFAAMFEESQTDRYQIMLFEQKKQTATDPQRPLTNRERIKSYPPPQLELDLHGYTAAQAESATEAFIRKAWKKNLQTVRLIVGKGLHSHGKAVLPDVTEATVLRLKRQHLVLSHAWEKKDKRKSGAIIVYLKLG